MTPSVSSPVAFGIESLLLGVGLLLLGYLMARAIGALLDARLDGIHYAGMALFSLALLILVLMLAQIATRGAVFSHPWIARALIALLAPASVIVLILKRARSAPVDWKWWACLGVVVAGAIAMWCPPVFTLLPLGFTGDTRYHLVEASQLIDGGSTPTTYVIGQAPNGYPWLFHATLAFFANLTPGGRAADALSPVMVTLVAGGAAGFFALGRELIGRLGGAFFTTLFATMCGGVGFFITWGPALVPPRSGLGGATSSDRFGGDFVMVRSYNLAFHNLAPPLPRDLCFALLGGFLFLVLAGLKRSSAGLLLAAGFSAGLIGVTGGESFFIALAIEIGVVLAGDYSRWRALLLLMGSTLAVFSLWAGPMLVNYFRFAGFNDLSDHLVALPALAILGAWGVVTPLAALGAWWSFRELRRSIVARLLLIVFLATGVALVAAMVTARILGPGFQTLGRAHRYWPLFYLGLALLAAVGAEGLVSRCAPRWRMFAGGLAVVVVAFAVISPVLGTKRYPEIAPQDALLASTLRGNPSILSALSPRPGGKCQVAVPARIAQLTSLYSGYRVLFTAGNARHMGRLRWHDVPGFAGYETRRLLNNELTKGAPSPTALQEAQARFGIDAIVYLTGTAPSRSGAQDGFKVRWLNRACLTE